jgi:hypothetical protein
MAKRGKRSKRGHKRGHKRAKCGDVVRMKASSLRKLKTGAAKKELRRRGYGRPAGGFRRKRRTRKGRR